MGYCSSKKVIATEQSGDLEQTHLEKLTSEYDEKKITWRSIRTLLLKVGIGLSLLILSIFTARQILFPEPPKLSLSETIEAQSNVIAMTFTSDGSKLVTASGDTPVKLWNWKTKQLIRNFEGRSSNALSIAVSQDGIYIATGHGNFRNNETSKEANVKIWNAKTGQLLKILKGHTEQVRTVAFSPDGSRIASSGHDSTIKVWNTHTGKLIQSISAQTVITSIAFSNDGKVLASASDDETIKLWDSNNLQLLYTLEGHKGQILSIAFSPDDQFLVSGSGEDRFDQKVQENSVNVWNLRTKTIQRTLTGHDGWVWSVAVSQNGKYIASASYDGTIRVWNFNSGELLGIGAEHAKEVYAVRFSSDNQTLVSGSDDGKLMLWRIQP